jgi:hypothetical protein
MMRLFIFLAKWFWIICIAVTFLNAGIFWLRARQHIQTRPELEDGYRTLIIGFVTWGNFPWIVMGIGCVLGGVPSVFHFFRPRDGNSFVLAFFGSVFLIWILGTYWILFRGGAQMLVTHKGLFNVDFKTPRAVVLYWFLSLAGGIVAVFMMLSRDIPLPPFLGLVRF